MVEVLRLAPELHSEHGQLVPYCPVREGDQVCVPQPGCLHDLEAGESGEAGDLLQDGRGAAQQPQRGQGVVQGQLPGQGEDGGVQTRNTLLPTSTISSGPVT